MIGIFVFIVIIVLAASYCGGMYNRFVKSRNRVRAQWSQIDVQLKRRSELIPNLVECVKGFAKHENEAIDRVTSARAKMAGAGSAKEIMDADAELTAAIPRILALGEAYPDLKANANFMKLQADLTDTESKIAFSRQFYNDAVLKYNDQIKLFPGNIVAGMFGFGEEPFFTATAVEKQSVAVSF